MNQDGLNISPENLREFFNALEEVDFTPVPMHRPVEFKILLDNQETTYSSKSSLDELTKRIGILSDQEDLGLERENVIELRLDGVVPFSRRRGVESAVRALKLVDLNAKEREHPELDECVWTASVLTYLCASESITTEWELVTDKALRFKFDNKRIKEINEFAELIVDYLETYRIPSKPWTRYLAVCEPYLFGSFASPVIDRHTDNRGHFLISSLWSPQPAIEVKTVMYLYIFRSIKIPLQRWPECLPPEPQRFRCDENFEILRFVVVNSDERRRRMYVMVTYAFTCPEEKHTFHAVFELTEPLRLVHVVKTCGTKHPVKARKTKRNRFMHRFRFRNDYVHGKDVCSANVLHRMDGNTVRFDLYVCEPEVTRLGFVLHIDDGTVEPLPPIGLELRSGKPVFPSRRVTGPEFYEDQLHKYFIPSSLVEYI